jgi:hypothetical protein
VTGTSVLGIKYKDGVLIAADTAGWFVDKKFRVLVTTSKIGPKNTTFLFTLEATSRNLQTNKHMYI